MPTIDYETPKRVFLHYVFHVLFKRKGLIIWGFLLVFLSMNLAIQLSYPVYLGTAKVWVHKTSTQQINFFPDIQTPPITFSPISQGVNWIEFLNGKQMAMDIVEEFGLEAYYRNRNERPANFRERFWHGVNQVFNYPYQTLVRMGVLPPLEPQDYFLRATQSVLNDMESLDLVGLQTDILTLSVYGPTPELAQGIANHLARSLANKVVDVEQNRARFALEYAKQHLDEITSGLSAAEQELTAYQREQGVLNLKEQQLLQVTRADNLATQIETLEVEREKLLGKLEGLQQEVEDQRREFVSQVLLQRALSQIQDLNVELSMHEKNLKIAQEQYQAALEKAQGLISAEFVLKRLEREANTYSQMWSLFQDRMAKLEIETVSRLKEISMEVIDPAYVSQNANPVWPRTRDLTSLGILGGTVLGLFLAFMAEYFHDSVRTVREAEEELKLPVLGSIPELRRMARRA
ncbi:MAG: hypothetical protein AB1640_21045 [bacterium]